MKWKGKKKRTFRLQVAILINLFSVLVELNISLQKKKKDDEETFFNSLQME